MSLTLKQMIKVVLSGIWFLACCALIIASFAIIAGG